MTARGDQLIDNYNFDIYKLAQERGVGWMMAQTQISYLLPAWLMEEVIIETLLLSCSEKVLHMEAFMWNKNKTSLKSLMWAKLVHYNPKEQRSHKHDDDLMAFFNEIVNPLPSKMNFDERIQSLKTKVRKHYTFFIPFWWTRSTVTGVTMRRSLDKRNTTNTLLMSI